MEYTVINLHMIKKGAFRMTSTKVGASKRIAWITGLKGIACYGVFIHHLLLNLIPETYYGAPPGGLTWLLSSTPFGVVVNGNFYVFVFLMLSAYLIGTTFVNYDAPDLRSKVGTFCIKRYFRLMLPILSFAVLQHIFVHLGYWIWDVYLLEPYPSLLFVIKHAIRDVFIYSDASLTGPLWMLNYLFAGSYIALILSLPNRKNAKHWMIVIYGIAFALVIHQRFYYLAAAIAGVLLVDLQSLYNKIFEYKKYKWLPKLLILAGLFLGGVPSIAVSDPFFPYRYLQNQPELSHCCAAFLLLLGMIGEQSISSIQDAKQTVSVRVLSSAPVQFLGKISYPVYLLHGSVLLLLVSYLRHLCVAQFGLSMTITTGISVILLSIITILVSWLFYLFIERNTDRLCNRIHL